MCGIIAVLRKRTSRAVPDVDALVAQLADAAAASPLPGSVDLAPGLGELVATLAAVNTELSGEAGLTAMLDAGFEPAVSPHLSEIGSRLSAVEAYLDAEGDRLDGLEEINRALIAAKDVHWAIERDRLRAAREVADLTDGSPMDAAARAGLLSVQQALSALDRLEVRGRDSAGVQILVRNHGLDLDGEVVQSLCENRLDDPLFTNQAVRTPEGLLVFVYKAAAEIGELGDNTASMRASIRQDQLLHRALANQAAEVTVLGHTRWASVGIISEPNAHPVVTPAQKQGAAPFVAAVLNGDVDNYSDLIAADGLAFPAAITTDARVIPALVASGIERGAAVEEAVRSTVARFEGSVAIGVATAAAPDELHFCLRGSGQGLFIGSAPDAYIVASEPYGVVEIADHYLRLDGETPANPDNPITSQGQIVRLSATRAGERDAVRRISYDGVELPIAVEEWAEPSVTTRDIDRGDSPHYLLKEISESPQSFRKTLRGRLTETADGSLAVNLGSGALSDDLLKRIRAGEVSRVEVIGQGTAAVAGQAVADAIEWALEGSDIAVRAITATELSGFSLRDDMSGTLVVAISQSGTTTDTNRTVDLARGRGASVVAIVNRRGSDLVDKSDGVIYTSDGRDVEMSVASTKAFYAQIAAGFLLAEALATAAPAAAPHPERQAVLAALRDLPNHMALTLELRDEISAAASAHAPRHRYWAMVGNGPNLVAARELRIKLSELCYKSIAADVIEDKKHIDLSSEPMIFVCAAGLVGSTADDVAKEVAIFRAHKSTPIVVATEGEQRFSGATSVIGVPATHPRLAFVLSTMVGHLFGYEAALAIDASARPLREARGIIEHYVGPTQRDWFARFGREIAPQASAFLSGLRAGDYNGHLEASTATRTAALLRFASGAYPLDAYQLEFGKQGTPGTVVEDLAASLTAAIEELTRPVDAIKHQAKTVTVGISRSDETLLRNAVIERVLELGCPRDRITYDSLRTVAAIAPAIASVNGHSRYRVEFDAYGESRINVVDRSGVAEGLTSRTLKNPTLRGTKHRVADERRPLVSVGYDNRVVLHLPEVKDSVCTGLMLLHITLVDDLDVATVRSVLQGYRNRYAQLVDLVTEREPVFRDDLLAEVSTVDVLTAPVSVVASHWTS